MLIDRETEVEELNFVLAEKGAHLLTVSGRRRLGKTTLLVEWAKMSGRPHLYWVANRVSQTHLLRSFSQQVYRLEHSEQEPDEVFTYPSWEMALRQLTAVAQNERIIVILDEFPYAAEVEPALPSILQNVWDHHLKQTELMMVLCGSHIGMMERLQAHQAPLFGRISGHLRLKPLPFHALHEFLPSYSLDQRVAVYAMLGGVPAYLERFDDDKSLADNVRRHLFRPTGLFRTDPLYLLHDELQQPHNYLSVLLAIAEGHHTHQAIHKATGLEHITSYLGKLQELHFVERDLPVTVPEAKRHASRKGRYDFADAYLRFYYRFIYTKQHLLEQKLHDWLWRLIGEQLPSYVGLHGFEPLCRQWMVVQAQRGSAPFMPERIGSHWSASAQVDVVAINWREKQILLGEAKWTQEPIRRTIITQLIAKTKKVVPEGEWTVHYAFFSRNGFTDAAVLEAKTINATLIDLEQLGRDLHPTP